MRTAQPASAIPELSIVALKHSRECEGGALPEGAKGAVVHAYRGGAGYEVEFSQPFHCVVTVARGYRAGMSRLPRAANAALDDALCCGAWVCCRDPVGLGTREGEGRMPCN